MADRNVRYDSKGIRYVKYTDRRTGKTGWIKSGNDTLTSRSRRTEKTKKSYTPSGPRKGKSLLLALRDLFGVPSPEEMRKQRLARKAFWKEDEKGQ